MLRPRGRAAFLALRIFWLVLVLSVAVYIFNASFGFRLFGLTPDSTSHITSLFRSSWLGHGKLGQYLEIPPATSPHPIEILVQDAQSRFSKQLGRQSRSLKQATAEYNRRYGRKPPKTFDVWYDMAKKNNVSIIDDYDIIESALRPFWALQVPDIKQRLQGVIESEEWLVIYDIRGNQLVAPIDTDFKSEQMANWMKEFASYLPDLQIPYNILAEPRIAVPYDDLQLEAASCQDDVSTETEGKYADREWNFLKMGRRRPWGYMVKSCEPSAPARDGEDEISSNENFQVLPQSSNISNSAPSMLRFINDVAAVRDVCLNPSVQAQHGTLVSPDTMLLSQAILPIFSRNKLSTFSDILVPTPFYAQFPPDDEGETSWEDKTNDLYWAGTTTGGFHHDGSWRFTQRFRLISLLNDASRPITLLRQLPSKAWEAYESTIQQISERLNAKFTKQKLCAEEDCVAQKADPTLRWGEPDASNEYKKHRLVMDVDGQGSTDRFYKLLASGSTVLKQTLCEEWHDERLVPWVHYVPVSMHMEELPEIVHYLTEDDVGQEIAKRIADEGRNWWAKGLRNIDMSLYMFRLLLEWARVMDDMRDDGLPSCTETGSWVEPSNPDE